LPIFERCAGEDEKVRFRGREEIRDREAPSEMVDSDLSVHSRQRPCIRGIIVAVDCLALTDEVEVPKAFHEATRLPRPIQ
jgi:hypothetical protein